MAPLSLSEKQGGYSGGETPVPIPNTEVKPSSTDGTALETGWESRPPPCFAPDKAPFGLAKRGFFLTPRNGAGFGRCITGPFLRISLASLPPHAAAMSAV